MKTIQTKILVIGAGPAGSVAATHLARAGFQVTLVDQAVFPRDKVCGDALLPDSSNVLNLLNIKLDLKQSFKSNFVRVYAPNGSYINVNGKFICIQRQYLDHILQQTALEASVNFLAPYKLQQVEIQNNQFTGTKFVNTNTQELLTIKAEIILLATGAASKPLQLFEVCKRSSPSAIAARAYFYLPDEIASEIHLSISYDKSICPGYGWVFPCANNVFNIGAGFFYDSKRPPVVTNVRKLWEIFVEQFPPANQIVNSAKRSTPLKGAPLRTNLTGANFYKNNLLVIGEAAGTTYSFTGEGIGIALDCAIIAAESIIDNGNIEHIGIEYEKRIINEFRDRFHGYKIAQNWLASPTVCNFISWRANHGKYLHKQLEGMLTETADARDIFSISGILKSLLF